MNENYIRKLIKLVEDSDIESLEISRWGRKIRIVGQGGSAANGFRPTAAVAAAPAPARRRRRLRQPWQKYLR